MKTVARAIAAAAKSGLSAATAPFKVVMAGVTPKKTPAPANPLIPPPLPKAGTRVPTRFPLNGTSAKTAKSMHTMASAQSQVNLKNREAVATSFQRAREHANTTAQNLTDVRAQSSEVALDQHETRLVDLILQELGGERGLDTKVAANSDKHVPFVVAAAAGVQAGTSTASAAARGPTGVGVEASVKAATAVELIEKIETFMKSQRPGLAISLEGSLGARVEIERLGPKEVAVRVVGKNGPPSAEDISRIRDEIRARGLKVGAMSVA